LKTTYGTDKRYCYIYHGMVDDFLYGAALEHGTTEKDPPGNRSRSTGNTSFKTKTYHYDRP